MRTNRLLRTVALSAVCLAPAAVALAGDRAVVEGMSQRVTIACGSDGAHVQGMGNTVTLTGPCTSVLVEGSNNTVHIAMLGSLKVAGMSNKVYWSAGIDGATPKVTKEGVGNTVERKTPADSPTAATPTASAAPARPAATAAPAKPAAGTASATASTPSSGATATATPGAPSLAVSKGGKTVGMGASADGSASMKVKRGEPAPARPMASPASSMGTGTPIVVPNNQQVRTMECEGRAVSVSGNGNRLTLKGTCGPISVGGNENILKVGSTTRIDTSGNRNVVTYQDLVNDKTPTVTSGGSGNRVSKAEPPQ